ncbi:uncharacterized protein EKO05_0008880 [Ascochyta rabiei]|uniref:Uncharacterized protein n=1 Tax=Didymella rabiei TaxID=5454 RepID=A0A163ASJ2_DIDRA|nr:uncharacterized protein EKO05_0008880 [Ascochyta rabiei]KZM21358.1 hypothetical protein ST47_g7513 [Ascochyta rabiei]UPX18586.1 hypothetical protein EKO05_0008880 [Ascochyta rabiei]
MSDTPDTATHEYNTSATYSPKSGDKTVAQLRQHFEQPPPTQIDNRPARSMLPGRGYQKTEDNVLPALTFDSESELPVNRKTRSPSPSNDLESLRPTVYIADHPGLTIDGATAESSRRFNIEEENPTTSSSKNTNNVGLTSQKFVWVKDGVRVVDFAYAHAAPSAMLSPMADVKRVRLLSKFGHAHESESDVSDTSAQAPTDLGERKPALKTKIADFRAEKLNDSQSSSEDSLLLLPASVSTPPERGEDLTDCYSLSTEDLLLFPKSVYTPLSTGDRDVVHVSDEEPMLMFLLATVYTPVDSEVKDIVQGSDNLSLVHVPANFGGRHAHEHDA